MGTLKKNRLNPKFLSNLLEVPRKKGGNGNQ